MRPARKSEAFCSDPSKPLTPPNHAFSAGATAVEKRSDGGCGRYTNYIASHRPENLQKQPKIQVFSGFEADGTALKSVTKNKGNFPTFSLARSVAQA